jgi:hypothetical protein
VQVGVTRVKVALDERPRDRRSGNRLLVIGGTYLLPRDHDTRRSLLTHLLPKCEARGGALRAHKIRATGLLACNCRGKSGYWERRSGASH